MDDPGDLVSTTAWFAFPLLDLADVGGRYEYKVEARHGRHWIFALPSMLRSKASSFVTLSAPELIYWIQGLFRSVSAIS